MSTRELPEPQDEHDEAILGDIDRVGWSVLQIEPDDEDDDGPLYSFSLGLFHNFDHPEIILIGLSHEVACEIINAIGDHIQSGETVQPGRRYEDFATVPLEFLKVDPAYYEEYVGYALWLYDHEFPLLQCVWPLKSGEYPWDEGYPPEAAKIQPILDNSLAAAPSEGWPFEDAENTAAMTVRQIAQDGEPILLVCHDDDDGMWQFLTGGQVTMDDAMLVSLHEIHRIDETVSELVDLPLGWMAERSAVGEPWKRKQKSG